MLIIISNPALASDSQVKMSFNAVGGAVTDHTVDTWTATSGNAGFLTGGDNWNEGNAASRVVTLGYSKYNIDTKTNNRIKNTYSGDTSLTVDGAAVAENSYHMEDNKVNIPDELCTGGQTTPDIIASNGTVIEGQTPSHQSYDMRHTMLVGDGGEYESTGVVNDVNTSTSLRAEGNTGGVYAYYDISSEAGFNKSSTAMNFDKEKYGHKKAVDLNQSGFSAALDSEYTDHSKPFETVTNLSRLAVSGEVDIVNLTNTTL